MKLKLSHIPLSLTLFRLIISPLFFPFLLVLFLPYTIFFTNILLALLFLMIGATDFFDGYYARKFDQETRLGQLLDPIADKVLIASVLIALVAVHKLWFFWAVILIGRDFFVDGLRQVACEQKTVLQVSWLGKCKTMVHIVCLTWIIANPYQAHALGAPVWNLGELALIIVSVVLSLWSAKNYFRVFKQQIMQ